MMKDDLTRLQGYSVEPDERLWSTIMSTLAAQDRSDKRKKRTRTAWIFLALSLMLGGLFYVIDPPPVSFTGNTLKVFSTTPGSAPASNATVDEGTPDKEISSAAVTPVRPLDQVTLQAAIDEAHDPVSAVTGTNTVARVPAVSVIPAVLKAEEQRNIAARSEADVRPREHDATGHAEEQVNTEPVSPVIVHETARPPVAGDKNNTAPDIADIALTVDHNNAGAPVIVGRNTRKRTTRLYFTAMPTLGYQRIEANNHDNLLVESIKKVAAFSPDRLGIRAEAGFEIPVHRKLNAFGGLVYYQREQTIDYVEKHVEGVDVIKGPDGQFVTRPRFAYVERSFEYQVRNLGIQVGLNYQLLRRKFLHTAGTGVEFHAALNRRHQPNPDFTNNPSVYVFYNLYYRLQYPADTKLRAVFQPTLNYAFYINEMMNAPFYVKPYGLGLNLGATYHF